MTPRQQVCQRESKVIFLRGFLQGIFDGRRGGGDLSINVLIQRRVHQGLAVIDDLAINGVRCDIGPQSVKAFDFIGCRTTDLELLVCAENHLGCRCGPQTERLQRLEMIVHLPHGLECFRFDTRIV